MSLAPKALARKELVDLIERKFPLERPNEPLTNFAGLPNGTTDMMENPPNPVMSSYVLGGQPEYRFVGATPLESSQPAKSFDATDPCVSVNYPKFEMFAPMRFTTANTLQEGNQHGDNLGLYSTAIHPVDNPELEYPASYYAWKRNPIPTITKF